MASHAPDGPAGRGFYLAIDGPDGSGKSTLAGLAADALAGSGLEVVVRAEPERNGPLWPAIRDHRLSGEYPDETWLLVLAAASLAMQKRPGGTLDLRSAGMWVITDRSPLSMLAHYWRSVDGDLRDALISRFTPPDLLILLTPDSPGLLRRRLRVRGEAEEHIDETVRAWENYGEAGGWLAQRGWPVVSVDIMDDTGTEAVWQSIWKRIRGTSP